MTIDEAREVLAALAREDVDLVVIGAMAMAAQGLPRATHDLDLFVAPRIEALKRALRALFEDPSVDEIDPSEMAGAYPAVEYTPPHGRFSLDILTRLGEAFRWEDVLAEHDEVPWGHRAAPGPSRCREDPRDLRAGGGLMPVRKFRSVEQMPGSRPRRPFDPENLRIACELTELAYALHPWHFEPGVRKFASIEEASRHREEWERRQARRQPHTSLTSQAPG